MCNDSSCAGPLSSVETVGERLWALEMETSGAVSAGSGYWSSERDGIG